MQAGRLQYLNAAFINVRGEEEQFKRMKGKALTAVSVQTDWEDALH